MNGPPPMRSTRPAPEVIGVMLAAIVYAVVGVGIIVAGTVPPEKPAPTPTSTPGIVTPRPLATLNPSLITLIRDTNIRILSLGKDLEALLAVDPFVTGDVTSKIKEISAAATFAKGIADRIAIQPGGATIAAKLQTAYDAIVAAADTALSRALADREGIRRGAEAVVLALVGLPDIDALLAAALATASPSPSLEPSGSPTTTAEPTPTPSPTPNPTPTPTPTPTAEPTPSPTAQPTPGSTATPSPTIAPGGPNQLTNGGFESGLEPWTLVLASGTAGTLERTTEDHFSGKASAVATVTSGIGSPSAASIQQGGLSLQNGETYRVSVAARSSAPREIRIRLTTELGEVIASRVLQVTTLWSTQSFQVTPIGQFEDVTLQIEVGASGQRIWLDDVSLG